MSTLCTTIILGVHLATWHADRTRSYEEFNPGLRVQCDSVALGAYRNSEGGTSGYAAWVLDFGRVDLAVGAVAGYKRKPLMPLLVPSLELGGGFRASLLLPYEKGSAGVHLSWEKVL